MICGGSHCIHSSWIQSSISVSLSPFLSLSLSLSPLHREALTGPVDVSAHRVHLGSRPLQDVLLAVAVLGLRPPQLGHRAVLARVAVEARELRWL